MFIITTKFSKKRALAIVLVLAVLLTSVILLAGRRDRQNDDTQHIPIASTEDIVTFLESLGWQVDATPLEVLEVVIPREFNDVFEAYNQLQIESGFDLQNYQGMTALRHTYQITNYPGQAEGVVADVLVAEGRVIGGNIQSLSMDGFIYGLVPIASISS